ncbi:HTH-type transcriptional regulator SinR [Actinomadura rubteroloni]|uniref:HTH-type transcriptional regulator SinR n=1 Tax=Actinomadura rubteroloni TaxID=1926885 RepID=A0A2P4UM78_9ACTN|nr:XRE family transcriptional regulator [Actinomadura rubteroloni]POM26154.1 HTH-type transcriptional regulator SinR [Actinomadura rubteroloni]
MEPSAGNEAALNARIGSSIRRLREKSGLSMRELARRAGISQPFLSQIERGASAPSMVTIYRLAEALDVLPGALLPAPGTASVQVVRASEGRMLPVSGEPNSAAGRALLMRPDTTLEVMEYLIEPGQYLEEWFSLRGDLAVYVVTGQLDVEVEGAGTWRLGPRDMISHNAELRHRWFLVGDEPAHVILAVVHPSDGQ